MTGEGNFRMSPSKRLFNVENEVAIRLWTRCFDQGSIEILKYLKLNGIITNDCEPKTVPYPTLQREYS